MLQRKKTLLVEYRQLRKANAFVDRRFGEEDESLTAEEKAIARFQKQRMKEFGGGSLTCSRKHACCKAVCCSNATLKQTCQAFTGHRYQCSFNCMCRGQVFTE